MTEARPDPYGVLRHVAAMDPPGRRTISTAEARAVLDELAQREADLLTIEGQRADLAERLFDLEAEMEVLRAELDGLLPARAAPPVGGAECATCHYPGGEPEPVRCPDCGH